MNSNAGLLRPRLTRTRGITALNGVWRFAFEPAGEAPDWQHGVPGDRFAAVPGAWNEQVLGGLSNVHAAWYERRLDAPERRAGSRYLLRFDAAALAASVWLNGALVGTHEGGFLPFAFDVTDRLEPGREHVLVVRVEHGLSTLRTPVGSRPGASMLQNFPGTAYDFFPFGGLIRPVRLLTVPEVALTDVSVSTKALGSTAEIDIAVQAPGFTGEALLSIRGRPDVQSRVSFSDGAGTARLSLPDARLWQPSDPHLETLEVALLDGDRVLDVYTQPFGVRTIAVQGTQLLLNDEPVFLKGFGKHEDFPVSGRGLSEPVLVRDTELMRWVGANSYRTSHYPHAEEALDLADRAGILVVSETSAVGVNFYDDVDNHPLRLDYVRAELAALIARDRNHPSVIAWSVANEPFAKPIFQPGAPSEEALGRGLSFLTTLIDDAHRLDPTRPAMMVGAQGHPDEFLDLGDVVAVNRYYGWYTESGRLDAAAEAFGADLDALSRFGKPILVSEFGTDTLPGCHAAEAEMWSEEYQADFIERYLDEIAKRPFVIGAHVWNFADFKTSQSILRAGGLNHKGVFTRDRRPKLAAHTLRRRWTGDK